MEKNNNNNNKKSKNTIYLEEFCDTQKIELIGEYDKVRLTTMIHFKCNSCKYAIKKSFKCMTDNKREPPSFLAGTCDKCITRNFHH